MFAIQTHGEQVALFDYMKFFANKRVFMHGTTFRPAGLSDRL